VSTQYVKIRTGEIDAKIADARKRKQKDRETDAGNLWKLVGAEMRKQNYEVAADAIDRLLKEFADLPIVKTNDRQLRSYKATCDEKGPTASNTIVEMDFEDLPGLWAAQNGATAQNGDEPKSGRRSAHLNVNSGRVWHNLHGVTARGESISFWTRTRVKGPVAPMELILHESGGMVTYSWIVRFTVQTDWRQSSFKFSEFQPWNENAKNLKRGVDPARIFSFQLQGDSSGSGSGNTPEILLDTLRVTAGLGK
jgi:hypothetical protein